MSGINRAFQNLRPIASNDDLRNRHLGCRRGRPSRRLKLGLCVRRAHVGPDEAAPFLGGVGKMFDLLGHAAGGWFRHHFQHVTVDVHFPAVVQAAQTTIFIASEYQRYPSVRTVLVHHANLTIGVTKNHQIFTKQLRFDGRAIDLADLLYQADRRPMAAHHLPHGCLPFYAAQQIVFLVGQHGK